MDQRCSQQDQSVLDTATVVIAEASRDLDINCNELLDGICKHLSHSELYMQPDVRQNIVALLERAALELDKLASNVWEITALIGPGRHRACPPEKEDTVKCYIKILDTVCANSTAFHEEELRARLDQVKQSKPFLADIPARYSCRSCSDKKRKCSKSVPKCKLCKKHPERDCIYPEKVKEGSFLNMGGMRYVVPMGLDTEVMRCFHCNTGISWQRKDKDGRPFCNKCYNLLERSVKRLKERQSPEPIRNEQSIAGSESLMSAGHVQDLAQATGKLHEVSLDGKKTVPLKRLRIREPSPDTTRSNSSSSKRARTGSGAAVKTEIGRMYDVNNSKDDRNVESVKSNEMSASDMFQCLIKHGCLDLQSSIPRDCFSSYQIACGSFGDVWEAQMLDGTNVAVKVMRYGLLQENGSKSIKRAMREIYNWSKLEHKNIHKLLGVMMFEGRLGMVSAWMEQGTLRQYLDRHNNIDRYELCSQITEGVAYLHSENMIHGDLKGCNILVSRDGIAKLTDFDHSIISDCSLVFSMTTNVRGGTLRWMAPELLLEEEPPARNKMTDIYALGMTLLETITKEIPYPECQLDGQIFGKIARRECPRRLGEHFPNNERGDVTWKLLTQCWDYGPSSRPTASQVLIDLGIIRNM